jgi:NAD(P)-dependent dehydrogenase (short-subunit alcohol dehydrogenase family)
VALITGAGSGIGRAAAKALSDAGFACVLAGRREATLRETASLLANSPSCCIVCDLEKSSEADRLVDEAWAWRGRLDAVINNAGYAPPATIAQTDVATIERVFAVNAVAPAAIIARLWRHLAPAAAASPRRTTIINISSMAAHDPFPTLYAYAAAKAATHLLTRCAANEGAPLGVKAFAIGLGAVETAMLRTLVDANTLPTEATLSPEFVASVIAACVRGDHDADNGGVIWLPSPPLTRG